MLLLSMQSFVLAHEIAQSSLQHSSDVCAVCSIGSGHNGAIPSQQDSPVQIFACTHATPAAESLAVEPLRYTPEARAPPQSL
jgi:hypothetical protein